MGRRFPSTFNKGLLRAAEQGDVETLRQMLDQGADVDTRRHNGWTALMVAAAFGKTEAIELLLSRGADPELTDDGGNTALHHAACGGKVPILRALIERGVDVEARTHRGWTPLHDAVFDERIRAVRCLIKAGADVNAQTEREIGAFTPLKGARGNSTITDLLQAAGAKLDPWCDEVVAETLARAETAQSEGRTRKFRQQAKDAFVQAAYYGQIEVVRSLLAVGMPAGACNQGKKTAIWNAAVAGHDDVFQTLLEAGADVETAEPLDWPILVAAAGGGSTENVRVLLERGCDPNGTGADGFTPLMAATLGDHAAVVGTLLDAGADPHARAWSSAPKKTALILAQDGRKKNVIPLLAEAMGLSPEDVAEDPAYVGARRFRKTADTPEFQAVLQGTFGFWWD